MRTKVHGGASAKQNSFSVYFTYFSYEEDHKIKREMLFCEEIFLNANAEATMKVIKDYYDEHELDMSWIVDNTSDGCPTMMGRVTGVLVQIKYNFSIFP